MAVPLKNENLELVKRELRRFGVEDIRPNYSGGGHYLVNWSHNGKTGVDVISSTPSDNRTRWNERGEVRRQLKAAGFLPLNAKESKPKALRVVSSNGDAVLLRNEVDSLKENQDALTDLILETLPIIQQIAQATSTVSPERTYRVQTEVTGGTLGLILSLLAANEPSAVGKLRFALSKNIEGETAPQQPKVEAVAPAPVLQAVEERPAAPAVEAPEPAAQEEQVCEAVVPKKHALLMHLFRKGPQSERKLYDAGLRGYADGPKGLYILLDRARSAKHIEKDEDGDWTLTRDGAKFALDKINNPVLKRPQRRLGARKNRGL